MKYLVCSDIHGAIDSVDFLIDKFETLKCDKIILLGDVLYHGPRNDLPNFYEPKAVIKKLNLYKDKIICIKGNCEAEVDQMVLDFKILDSYYGTINDLDAHFEHGHHLDEYNGDAEVVFYGHIHIPVCEKKDNSLYINPGSITLPKNNTKRSYIIWDDHEIICYGMDDTIVFSYKY